MGIRYEKLTDLNDEELTKIIVDFKEAKDDFNFTWYSDMFLNRLCTIFYPRTTPYDIINDFDDDTLLATLFLNSYEFKKTADLQNKIIELLLERINVMDNNINTKTLLESINQDAKNLINPKYTCKSKVRIRGNYDNEGLLSDFI